MPGERTTLRLREVDRQAGIAVPESDLRDDQIEVITDAVSNESTTVYGYEPFRNLEYARLNGTYYQVRTVEAGTEAVEQPVLVVTPVANRSKAVPLEEYDGHVMELVAPVEGNSSSQVLHPDTPGFHALVPEPRHEYVTWENNTYRLTVEYRQVEQQARRVHVKVVGTSTAEFVAFLRQHKSTQLRLGDLPQQARDILEEAITDEYTETAPYSDEFDETLAAVRQGRGLSGGEGGRRYLIVYNETLYRAEIRTIAWE